MKKLFAILTVAFAIFTTASFAQGDKSKRPSPPATVSQKIASGATIKIDYSQPALKGRTIGKDVEPMNGKAWRMGANEATVFETNKDVTIDGQKLPAGKYSLFGIMDNDGSYTLIFNKSWNIWGTMYDQNKDKDALHVKVKPTKAPNSEERLVYHIDPSGRVAMQWGTLVIPFQVK
jgi:hypothetical protein